MELTMNPTITITNPPTPAASCAEVTAAATASNTIALPQGHTANAVRSLMVQLACGGALGLAVLYGVAFAESPLAHNAAHDVRHITVKPCH
jgi:cobalt transporter subunit CbtB